MKYFQFSSKKPCYFCGAEPPSSKEHVPARMLFRGHDCDRFTVPSCPEHNMSKTDSDQTVISAVLQSMDQVQVNMPGKSLSEAVCRSIEAGRSSNDRVRKNVRLQPLLEDPPASHDFDLPYIDSCVQYLDWFTKLTAALCWVLVGDVHEASRWEDASTSSTTFIKLHGTTPIKTVQERIFEQIIWHDSVVATPEWKAGWQPKPRPYPMDIYEFRLGIDRRNRFGPITTYMWHRVVRSHSFITTFVPSDRLLAIFDELPPADPPASRLANLSIPNP